MGYKFQDSTAIYQATWTSSTAQNATLAAYGWGYSTAMVTVQNTGTITGGAIGFQVFDGNNWFPVTGTELYSANTDQTYSLSGGSVAIACDMTGFSQFRVILSTVITGSGSVFVSINESGAPLSSLVGKTPGSSGATSVTQGTSPWVVAGNVASGATDSGNPVKIGGVYNTSLPTLTNGQRGDLQFDSSARLITNPRALQTSTDSVATSTVSAVPLTGQTTSNTTAVQLSSTSSPSTNGIIVKALSTNSAVVFVGPSSVTTSNGYELLPGEAAPFTASNITALYVIDASSTTDKVCWSVV